MPSGLKTDCRPSKIALPTSGTEWLPMSFPSVELVLQPITTMFPAESRAFSTSSFAAFIASLRICSTIFLSSTSYVMPAILTYSHCAFTLLKRVFARLGYENMRACFRSTRLTDAYAYGFSVCLFASVIKMSKLIFATLGSALLPRRFHFVQARVHAARS